MSSIAAGERHGGGGASHSSTDPEYARKRKDYIAKQQRWLLFLRHCAKCQSADNACQYGQSCAIAKQLWRHILTCSDGNCTYSRWALHPPWPSSFSPRKAHVLYHVCWHCFNMQGCITCTLHMLFGCIKPAWHSGHNLCVVDQKHNCFMPYSCSC